MWKLGKKLVTFEENHLSCHVGEEERRQREFIPNRGGVARLLPGEDGE